MGKYLWGWGEDGEILRGWGGDGLNFFYLSFSTGQAAMQPSVHCCVMT